MKTLTLSPDELNVDSFTTPQAVAAEIGTSSQSQCILCPHLQ